MAIECFSIKIVGTGSLTDADVGKNYRVGFWMKADKAGVSSFL